MSGKGSAAWPINPQTDADVEYRDVALTHNVAADVLILLELVFALSRGCV